MRSIRLSLRVPVALGMGMQARSCLPQGRCPPLERLMCLGPVVALLYMHLITDVPAAVDLWRTHPFTIHRMREAFAIENRTSQFRRDAPDTRTHAITGPTCRGILRHSDSQLDGQAGLQKVREVGIFMQIPLTLFHVRQGTHPGQITCIVL